MRLTFFLLTVVIGSIRAECGGEFKIVCYFSSWTGIHPEAKNCTHIVYTFARIEDDNTMTGEQWLMNIKSLSFLCLFSISRRLE